MHLDSPSQQSLQLSLREAVWLLPPAFAAHMLEEAPGFTRWVNWYASKEFTRADFVRNNAWGMATGTFGCVLVSRFPVRKVVLLFFTGVLAQVFFNTFFHLWATLAFRAYSPGLVTSLLLYPPLSAYLACLAHREGLFGIGSGATAFVFGGALHFFIVNRQVFYARLL